MVLDLAASPESLAAADAVLAAEEQTEDHHVTPQQVKTLRTEFEQHLRRDDGQANAALRNLWHNPAFQEAIIWQNRSVLQRLGWLQKQAIAQTNYRTRNTERLLANYLQRYCVKNDTIGFFGPVGWGKLGLDSFEQPIPTVSFHPGEALVTNRQVFFEQWSMDALAEKLSQQAELRPWLPPCPLPNFYLAGATLHLPAVAAWLRAGKFPPAVKSSFPLSAVQVRLLQLCDGNRPAKKIAAEILRDPQFNLTTEAEVYHVLEQFCDLGVLRWKFELPLELHPERTLRAHLERIDDLTLRHRALAALDELESAKHAVARAVGNPAQLDQDLAHLETTFTRLTNRPATRREGQFYAGRTLVYEDCRRDLTLTFGPELLHRLGPPLSLLLTSARWFTYQVAQTYREAFTGIYERLRQQQPETPVDLTSFLPEVLPLLADAHNPLLTKIVHELQQRWVAILFPPAQFPRLEPQRPFTYTAQDLLPRVQATFEAPHPGWTLARYQSPDVMLAAPSVEAMQQGNYQLVLGEIHLCNTIDNAYLFAQHPCPAELVNAYTRDLPQPVVTPVISAQWSSQRNSSVLGLAKDLRFAFETMPSNLSRAQIVTLGELIVERSDGQLRICTRDHRRAFDLIDFFGYSLSTQNIAFPAILPAALHTPRMTIDDLVVCRESWHFRPAELPFAQASTRADLLLAARRWASAYHLPRWVFVKAAREPKPFFVDLRSPIFLESFAKTIRQQMTETGAEPVMKISEMLPDFEHLWLNDTAGERYTSELRFVMLDGGQEPGILF